MFGSNGDARVIENSGPWGLIDNWRGIPPNRQARLLNVIDQAEGRAGERDRVLFGLMLRTGVRIGSALGIDVDDVDLELGEIRLRHLKGGGEHRVFLHEDIRTVLEVYMARIQGGPLWPGRSGR